MKWPPKREGALRRLLVTNFSNFAHIEQNSAKPRGDSALESNAATKTQTQTRKGNKKMKSSYKQYSNRRYLAQVDFPKRERLTVAQLREEIVSSPDKPDQEKLVVYFEEREKGMVLNQANGDTLADICRQTYPEIKDPDNPGRWIGLVAEVGVDPHVMFGRKQTGGLRLWPVDDVEAIRVEAADPKPRRPAELAVDSFDL